jgi:hypothetical protein
MAGKGTTQFMNEKLAEETPMFSKVQQVGASNMKSILDALIPYE